MFHLQIKFSPYPLSEGSDIPVDTRETPVLRSLPPGQPRPRAGAPGGRGLLVSPGRVRPLKFTGNVRPGICGNLSLVKSSNICQRSGCRLFWGGLSRVSGWRASSLDGLEWWGGGGACCKGTPLIPTKVCVIKTMTWDLSISNIILPAWPQTGFGWLWNLTPDLFKHQLKAKFN